MSATRRTPQSAIDGEQKTTWAAVIAKFTKIYTLPRAETESVARYGYSKGNACKR